MAKVVIRKGELLCQSTEKITYAAFLLSNSKSFFLNAMSYSSSLNSINFEP